MLTWQATVLLAQILDDSSGLVELPSNEQGILPVHGIKALQAKHFPWSLGLQSLQLFNGAS